jgi:hypothetical protein
VTTTGRHRLEGDGTDGSVWARAIGYTRPMATDKRERQRANRELRKAEEAKIRRRERMFNTIRRGAVWLVVVVVVVVLAAIVF